jgi:predicted O-methyltransferase YrrM
MQSSVLGTVKRAYATGARATGRGLTRIGVLPHDPPPRSQRYRHWAYSLTKAHDSLGISDLDVPWWTYEAIDAVERWLGDRTAPVRAFEWGSGASTIWLAGRVAEVHSVEHHRAFGEMIQQRLAGTSWATLTIVEPEPSSAPVVGSAKEGHGQLDFARYVAHVDAVGGAFDLIVIDGRAREACLTAARPHLAPGGLIVFDNTMRRRYRAAIAAAPVVEQRYRGLTPTLPYPDQTSLLTAS